MTSFPDGIKQKAFPLPSGEVLLPILYRKLVAFGVTYTAEMARARPLLPSPRFRPIAVRGDRALVTLIAFSYRETSIGPYNEFAVVIPVLFDPLLPTVPLNFLLRKTRFGRLGAYISHLPVTTRIALEAGREVWGFPKIVAGIDIEEREGRWCCELTTDPDNATDPSRHILTLNLTARPGRRLPAPDTVLYSEKDARVLKTVLTMRGGMRTLPRDGATLDLGDHPIARELASLGLSRRPAAAFFSRTLRTRLPAACATFDLS